MLPDAPRCSQMLPGAPRCSHVLPDAPRCSQMLPGAPRCSQVLPDAPRCSQVLPGALKCSQMLPDAPRCSQVLPDAPRCFITPDVLALPVHLLRQVSFWVARRWPEQLSWQFEASCFLHFAADILQTFGSHFLMTFHDFSCPEPSIFDERLERNAYF